ADMAERLLQRCVAQRAVHVLLEAVALGWMALHHHRGRRRVHREPSPIAGRSAMPASTSATWRAFTALPSRLSLPAMLSRQPRSPASSVPAPVAAMSAVLSETILLEISGYLTQKVPPKPQQSSAPGSSTSFSPSTAASNRRGCALTPSSRKPEQESW